MHFALSMFFKVCTKNPARKAARTEWVVEDFYNLGVGKWIYGVGLKFYVSQMEVQYMDLLRICSNERNVDIFQCLSK